MTRTRWCERNAGIDIQSGAIDTQSMLIALVILLFGSCLLLASSQIAPRSGGEILREAGFVIIGTVLVSFVYEYVLRRHHDESLLKFITNSLVTNGPKYGLVSIVERLDFGALFDRLERGDTLLWLDTYCPDAPNYQEHLLSAIQRGATVHMLAIRPKSEAAKWRANEIKKKFGYSFPRFAEEASNQIEKLKEVLEGSTSEVSQRVKLRLYDDLPCIPMYIHLRGNRPDVAFTSYFLGNPTFSEPHLKWTVTTDGFLRKLYDYFLAKWEAHSDNEVELIPLPPR